MQLTHSITHSVVVQLGERLSCPCGFGEIISVGGMQVDLFIPLPCMGWDDGGLVVVGGWFSFIWQLPCECELSGTARCLFVAADCTPYFFVSVLDQAESKMSDKE